MPKNNLHCITFFIIDGMRDQQYKLSRRYLVWGRATKVAAYVDAYKKSVKNTSAGQ